ncbi:MAG: putative porin [Owenweeksia sp.]|nr:putative porin [Owenweeksia sp.]
MLALNGVRSNKLEVKNETYTNKVYYNQDARPSQASDAVNVFKLDLRQNFTLWNFIHQDNNITYQTSSSREIMPLPQWYSRNSLYFQFELFGGALTCLTGAEMNYFSSYFSPSYNPATGVFYNDQKKEIGNYPYVDIFANFKLQKARIFVKYENINQGLSNYTYYAAPHYPMADRTLRVGITWRFFN